MRILVAGIGNIFLGDDAFGVEMIRALKDHTFPAEVCIRDFGIRGFDLACALTDGFDAVVLLDTIVRGDPPGTVCLLRPEIENSAGAERRAVDGHRLDPWCVLQFASAMGSIPGSVYVIGCEPERLEPSEAEGGLSPAVSAAIPSAVELLELLLPQLLKSEKEIAAAINPLPT